MADRVSTSMVYGSLMGSLQNNLQNLLDLQRQQATGNKYSKLSDNPADIARALSLESSMVSNMQFISNQEDAVTMLKYAETAMDKAVNIIQTIRTKVVYAGNGALDATAVAAIADEVDGLKQELLDTLNTKVAGKYIFGGTDTTTRPFVTDSSGQIRYVGSDERIRYEIEQGLLGDVSFTGTDVMPSDYKSYFVCSHYVPLEWQWTGREEKVQITVGNRTLPVYIPEQWIDEVSTGSTKPTDYNQFRDPGELSGISLDNIAMLVNRALVEQGADMLVTASVEKNYDTGLQRLIFKSNTGEPVSITGWPATDYSPMPQSVAGLTVDTNATIPWNQTLLVGSAPVNLTGLAGKSLIVSANGSATAPAINLDDFLASNPVTYPRTADGLAGWLNDQAGPASIGSIGVVAGVQGGKLVLTSPNGGDIRVDGSAVEALFGSTRSSVVPEYQGLMGSVNTLAWRDDTLGKGISITLDGGTPYEFAFENYRSISDLVNAINAAVPVSAGDLPFASLVSGRLVLQSTGGNIEVADYVPVGGSNGGTMQLFGYDGSGGASLNSSTSSLTIQLGDQQPIKIYINEGDELDRIAERINAIEGIYARTSADGDQLVVVAQRTGANPADPLAVDAAQEKLHYPSFILRGEGMAMSLFDFTYKVEPETGVQTGVLGSKEQTRPVDHSHIDLFDYLGMETALKSVEFKFGKTLTVGTENPPGSGIYTGEPLHWRVMSGSHVTEIKLNPGEYTMEQLADRLQNAGAGWLEVVVDVFQLPNVGGADSTETGLGTSANREDATSRLVIRSKEGSPVVFMDMNAARYAEEMGLSTAVRTDDSTGVEYIKFPTAPCLDDNLAAAMRVQMTCGKSYDIRLTRKDVEIINPEYDPLDPSKGPARIVDRVKVMEQIARQVNAQAGEEVLKVVVPVNSSGQKLPNSASLVAVTGEPFSVVDLPIADPVWTQYTAGIAAQMGIHTGVTSIPTMRDDQTIADVGGSSGTIRFESLGRTVEIDVSVNDTVKDIMDRLRTQAGDWLYINYFDPAMGNKGGQEGDTPIISIAAKDGSAVNIIDVKGSVAQDQLSLNTSIQGKGALILPDGTIPPGAWEIDIDDIKQGLAPAQTFSITVDGYTHTIDLTAMRDVNGNGKMDAYDLVETINARMQDSDVRAELNKDGYLVLWSPRGYTITVEAWQQDPGNPPINMTNQFLGTGTGTTPYRGGYDLENAARTAPGITTQNVTVRSGANQAKQNFFGVLDDISAAIRSQNRDALGEKMLPKIDKFMDNLLKMLSTSGALQGRYEGNTQRMKLNSLSMLDVYDSIAKVDLAEVSTNLKMAQAMYEASLAVIAKIVQPTLLDFLR